VRVDDQPGVACSHLLVRMVAGRKRRLSVRTYVSVRGMMGNWRNGMPAC
jgi:hypothetical protein